MAINIIKAVSTSTATNGGIVPIKRALLSVSDKTNLIELAQCLASLGVQLLSTGGTAAKMREAGLSVTDVSEHTQFPEIMDGRVKTLHPKIHGGLLGVRDNAVHAEQMAEHGILPIDLVVLNLYAFEATVASKANFSTCVENIDIGGPSMLRSSAKNHRSVTICTSPDQYTELMAELKQHQGATSLAFRTRCAARAFATSAEYDTAISNWFQDQLEQHSNIEEPADTSVANLPPIVHRTYTSQWSLKYGCNPHQKPAGIYSLDASSPLPFSILNGTPGYINLLDAVNGYQLVRELRKALGKPAATSFKHVSPAGAAVASHDLSPDLAQSYEAMGGLTPQALAYVRARNADPLSSFGDFVALSDVVDEATAKVLKREVSDGIVAPGYAPEALAILKAKKGGKFIILEANVAFVPPEMEYRECYGMTFAQRRNDLELNLEHVQVDTTAQEKENMPALAQEDLLLAAITLKYTQSNSVGYAAQGQMIGIGAGQQSRVDCVKLAGRKVAVWHLRQHPKVQNLKFKASTKRQERVNARVRYIEGDMAGPERRDWEQLLDEIPEPLSEEEKATFLETLSEVSLASDAFFPFRDSIDHASKLGVQYISQPGGSTRDDQVIEACKEYGMKMAFSSVRLFHH